MYVEAVPADLFEFRLPMVGVAFRPLLHIAMSAVLRLRMSSSSSVFIVVTVVVVAGLFSCLSSLSSVLSSSIIYGLYLSVSPTYLS